ncbi:MAG TPA: hypothetical protein VFW59_02320 [Gallionella sp.]|nr:hypothetical protein [Gallionella sp.]
MQLPELKLPRLPSYLVSLFQLVTMLSSESLCRTDLIVAMTGGRIKLKRVEEIVGLNENQSFSIQVEMIRQMQSENGQVACYATPATVGCSKKQSECSWRHDCFHDAEEAGERRNKEA